MVNNAGSQGRFGPVFSYTTHKRPPTANPQRGVWLILVRTQFNDSAALRLVAQFLLVSTWIFCSLHMLSLSSPWAPHSRLISVCARNQRLLFGATGNFLEHRQIRYDAVDVPL